MIRELKDEYDVIIYGGGLRGSLVGDISQKYGNSVLISENLQEIGGKCSELNRHGIKFDPFGKWDTITGMNTLKEGALRCIKSFLEDNKVNIQLIKLNCNI